MKKILCLFSCLFVLLGCNAIYTNMSKSDLTIQSKMSSTIWIDPVVPEKTSVYVQIRNTSSNNGFDDLANDIKKALMSKGFLITNNPDEANLILQANVLKAVMFSDVANVDEANSSALLTGSAVGFAVGAKNNDATAIGAGLLAGLASMYFDANTKDNYYAVQVDIRITQKSSQSYNTSSFEVSKQGDSAVSVVSSNQQMNSKSYTSTLTLLANKVNLKEYEAMHELNKAIVNSLVGIF